MPDLTGFDANDHEPNTGFDPLPKGDYTAIITGSDWKDTKAGDGRYIEMVLEVIEGEYKGRRLWDNLNLDNKSEKAVKIANGTLSAVCRAVGVMRPKKSEELHGKPISISVDTEVYREKVKNRIKSYKAVGSSPAPAAAPAAASEDSSSKPPWAK